MNNTNTPKQNNIAAKILYIKILFIIDRKKFKGNPVFIRKLRRSGEEFPVYDQATFFQFTKFGALKEDIAEWKFTSAGGEVDALQIFPFEHKDFFADPAKTNINKMVEGAIKLKDNDNLLVICQYYNGFQGETGSWAGVRADKNTDLLRLIVDFSSVMTADVDKELFVESPTAYWNQYFEKKKSPIEFEFNDGRVFSISQKNVSQKDVIMIKYKMNWDNLITLQSIVNKKEIEPKRFKRLF